MTFAKVGSFSGNDAPETQPQQQNMQLADEGKNGQAISPSVANICSLAESLHQHAIANPNKRIYSWLNKKGEIASSFTRMELWNRSKELASHLRLKYGLKHGDRALVVFPFGIEFIVGFVACQLLGVTTVSVYPPNPKKFKVDIPKFNHFVSNSKCKVALTTKSYKAIVKLSKLKHSNWPSDLTWAAIDGVSSTAATNIEFHKGALDDIALIQYTSGSTGAPKGIMISNGNILHQLKFLSALGNSSGSNAGDLVLVSWAPQYHDMGLLATFLLPMYCGGESLAMSPLDFLSNPTLWPKCLEKYAATATSAPNFGYGLTCKRLEAAGKSFNCRTVKVAAMGAEPSDITLLPKIKRFMGIASENVLNLYGMAENTLLISGNGSQTLLHEGIRWSVGSIQFSRENETTLAIVGKDSQPVQDGTQGEIWISSPSVAKGYYGQPELTRQVFGNHLDMFPGKTFLRSGDMGVIEHDQLYICSRIKDLIIINGKNIAPNDVEKYAEATFPEHIRPGCSVAFQPSNADATIVLVLELRPEAENKISIERLADMIHASVEKDEGVSISDLLLVRKGTVPKTTSGKVQRNKTKQLWENQQLRAYTTTSGNKLENCTSFKQLLENAGVEDWDLSVAENGIDSLKLVNLVQEASNQFGYSLSYEDASSKPCHEILADFNKATKQQTKCSIRRGFHSWSEESNQIPGTAQILLGQLFVVIVLFGCMLASTVPASLYIKYCWNYNSSLWVVNGRAGPLIGLAFIIWCVTYTIVCICAKWILIGRQVDGQSFQRWSFYFARWWTVQRLVGVWEAIVGVICSNTILLNTFYTMLGAKVSPYARIDAFFREWDLVTIGPHAKVDGFLFPRVFHGKRVYLREISIGARANIGSGAIVQLGACVGTDTTVEPRTLVPEGSSLANDTCWNGNPCTKTNKISEEQPVSKAATVLRALGRLLIVPIFPTVVLSTYFGVNLLLPATPSHYSSQVWTQEGFLYVGSFMVAYQLTGFFLLFALVLLKWSFLAPYVTDRFTGFVVMFFFPTAERNTFSSLFFVLFGLNDSTSSYTLMAPGALPASKAHLIEIGDDVLLANPQFSPKNVPGVAKSVWSWIASRGSLRSPWNYKVDIKIPSSFQAGQWTRFEDGIHIEPGAFGTSPYSRVRKGDVLKSGELAIGSPASVRLKTEASTSFVKPGGRIKFLSAILDVLWVVVLAMTILFVVQVIRSMPIYGPSFNYEARNIIILLVGVLLALAIVCAVLVVYKWVFIGTPRKEDALLDSLKAAQMLFVQNTSGILFFNFHALFAGMLPMNLFQRLMGHKLDLTTVFINELSWIDPNDDVTLHPWAVVDTMASCNGHIVDRTGVHKEPVVLHENAILHPRSMFHFGSLGRNSELFPLAKPLTKVHIPDDQLYMGNPAHEYIVLPSLERSLKVKKDLAHCDLPQDMV